MPRQHDAGDRRVEAELGNDGHAAISALLATAFLDHAAFCEASSYGVRPDHHPWLEESDSAVWPSWISSVGSSASVTGRSGSPAWARSPRTRNERYGARTAADGRVAARTRGGDAGRLRLPGMPGRSRRLLRAGRGWHRVHQKTLEIDPGGEERTVSEGPALILPTTAPLSAWPHTGKIGLRGMRW